MVVALTTVSLLRPRQPQSLPQQIYLTQRLRDSEVFIWGRRPQTPNSLCLCVMFPPVPRAAAPTLLAVVRLLSPSLLSLPSLLSFIYINSDGCGSRYHFAASPPPTPITSTTDLSHTEAQRLRGFYLGAAPPDPRFCMISPGVSNKRRGDGVPRVRSGGLVAVRVILCSTSDRIQVARVNQSGCPKRGRRYEVRSDETER